MRRAVTAAFGMVLVAASGACSSGRGDELTGVGGASTAPGTVFVPGTVGAADVAYVDGLATNFEEGGRLTARLDAEPARCVAARWVAVFEPARLAAAAVPAEAMADVTLSQLTAAVPLDRPRALALVESYAACDASMRRAFLDSLLVTGQISTAQHSCLLGSFPDELIETITVDVLTAGGPSPDDEARYQRALEACPPG